MFYMLYRRCFRCHLRGDATVDVSTELPDLDGAADDACASGDEWHHQPPNGCHPLGLHSKDLKEIGKAPKISRDLAQGSKGPFKSLRCLECLAVWSIVSPRVFPRAYVSARVSPVEQPEALQAVGIQGSRITCCSQRSAGFCKHFEAFPVSKAFRKTQKALVVVWLRRAMPDSLSRGYTKIRDIGSGA